MPKNRKPEKRKLAKTLPVNVVQGLHDVEQKRSGWLLVVQGAEVDLGRHVLCDHPITVGRDPDVDLPLSDGSISRAHCSIERDPETGRYVVVDLGSTNGTTVNGTTVKGRLALTEGDKVFLGASVLRFSFADAVDLQYQERVEEMVTTDPLTGLATKRQYDSTFSAAAQRAERDGSPLTVLVADMDGLKQINDTHGHEMGGFAITEIATLMKKVFGSHGELCRFGGDEFVGCFPGLDREQARSLADRLRLDINDHHFTRGGIEVSPTISVGLATYPGDTSEPNELFTIADRAMYKAKRRGRNRVATMDDTGRIPHD
ncbi:MAG: diguanylate cyclase [Deltaproteobacteria bacterium]|nr:diguanylate cyclase [Deltaproteobacteria bacterium]